MSERDLVVDVVAAWPLAKTWSAGQSGRGWACRGQWAPSVFLTRKAILMDSGSMKDVLLVSGMPRGCGGERAQRAHVLVLLVFRLYPGSASAHPGSGGNYLHACLYTRILICNYYSSAYIDVGTGVTAFLLRKTVQKILQGLHLRRPGGTAFCSAKPCKKSYWSRVYMYVRPGLTAFLLRKTVQNRAKKLFPRRRVLFFCSLNSCASWSKLGG